MSIYPPTVAFCRARTQDSPLTFWAVHHSPQFACSWSSRPVLGCEFVSIYPSTVSIYPPTVHQPCPSIHQPFTNRVHHPPTVSSYPPIVSIYPSTVAFLRARTRASPLTSWAGHHFPPLSCSWSLRPGQEFGSFGVHLSTNRVHLSTIVSIYSLTVSIYPPIVSINPPTGSIFPPIVSIYLPTVAILRARTRASPLTSWAAHHCLSLACSWSSRPVFGFGFGNFVSIYSPTVPSIH